MPTPFTAVAWAEGAVRVGEGECWEDLRDAADDPLTGTRATTPSDTAVDAAAYASRSNWFACGLINTAKCCTSRSMTLGS